MLNLHRRGRIWWARGSVRGVRVQKSLDTQVKENAKVLIAELERNLHSGIKARVPWSQFQEEFLAAMKPSLKPRTYQKYQFVLARFGRFLGSSFVESIQMVNMSVISGYMASRASDVHPTRKTPIGPEGLKSDQRHLHRIFSYAVECGYLEKNPVQYHNLSSRSRNTQPFTDEEISRMLEACDSRPRRGDPYPLKAVILTFLYTGLRISDVIGLEKREVDLQAGRIVKRTEKRGKVVNIPLHPELVKALSPLIKGNGLVFQTASGKPVKCLDDYLRRLWKQAGIQGAHPHRFRDTFAVRLLARGASLYDVAKLMGITVAVAEKFYSPYVHSLQERGRELIESLQTGTIGVQKTK